MWDGPPNPRPRKGEDRARACIIVAAPEHASLWLGLGVHHCGWACITVAGAGPASLWLWLCLHHCGWGCACITVAGAGPASRWLGLGVPPSPAMEPGPGSPLTVPTVTLAPVSSAVLPLCIHSLLHRRASQHPHPELGGRAPA